jgi:hypothetical protein
MTVPFFEDRAPEAQDLTAYDETHAKTYLRLLDAAADGAEWQEVAKIVFGIDPEREPERAKTMHHSHLARARWIAERGFRQLLESAGRK